MKQSPSIDYGAVYRTALQVNWRVEDVMGDGTLDFSRRFLPEAWVDAGTLGFLSQEEQIRLNQLRAHSYACLVALIEEYVVPFVLNHARGRIEVGTPEELCAIVHFAEEECKHIQLFRRFSACFLRGFNTLCDVIGPSALITEQVLRLSPLGVALSILHLEWLTQLHYVSSVRQDHDLDPLFSSVLRHHWLEEAQHTKLDTALVTVIAGSLTEIEVARGIDDYLLIVNLLDEGFGPQVDLDLTACARAIGREISAEDQRRYRSMQRQSYRKTFLTEGMRHPRFQATLAALSATAVPRVLDAARVLESGRPSITETARYLSPVPRLHQR